MRRIDPATAKALLFVVACAVLLHAGVTYAAVLAKNATAQELRAFVEQPLHLLAVMYLGALGSALKTVGTARRAGSDITLFQYLGYGPETAAAAIAVLFAWLTLLFTDQLNFAAAAAYGAIANTGADILRAKGRTAALAPDQPKT